MLIFLKQKLVLFAMPKTGSSALEQALRPHADLIFAGDPRNKHMTFRKYKRFIEPYLGSIGYGDMRAMCIMREPIDWLSSWYRYRHRDGLIGKPNSTKGLSFDAFALDYMRAPPPPHAHVGRQATFLSDKNDACGIDDLFAYEEFPQAVSFLQDRLNTSLTLAKTNVSVHMKTELSAPVAARLHEFLQPEYALYRGISRHQ